MILFTILDVICFYNTTYLDVLTIFDNNIINLVVTIVLTLIFLLISSFIIDMILTEAVISFKKRRIRKQKVKKQGD